MTSAGSTGTSPQVRHPPDSRAAGHPGFRSNLEAGDWNTSAEILAQPVSALQWDAGFDPERSVQHEWLKASTCTPLNNACIFNVVDTYSGTIHRSLDNDLIVVPGLAETGEPLYQAVWAKNSTSQQWDQVPKWWGQTVSDSAQYYLGALNRFQQSNVDINRDQALVLWSTRLQSDLELPREWPSRQPTVRIGSERDISMLKSARPSVKISLASETRRRVTPSPGDKIVRAVKSEAGAEQCPDDRAYLITKASLSMSGKPRLQIALALPHRAEDIQSVPQVLFDDFIPTADGTVNSARWDELNRQVCRVYTKMAVEENFPDHLVAETLEGRSECLDNIVRTGLPTTNRKQLLQLMANTILQDELDGIQVQDGHAGYKTPFVSSVSDVEWEEMSRGRLTTRALKLLPSSTPYIIRTVKSMIQQLPADEPPTYDAVTGLVHLPLEPHADHIANEDGTALVDAAQVMTGGEKQSGSLDDDALGPEVIMQQSGLEVVTPPEAIVRSADTNQPVSAAALLGETRCTFDFDVREFMKGFTRRMAMPMTDVVRVSTVIGAAGELCYSLSRTPLCTRPRCTQSGAAGESDMATRRLDFSTVRWTRCVERSAAGYREWLRVSSSNTQAPNRAKPDGQQWAHILSADIALELRRWKHRGIAVSHYEPVDVRWEVPLTIPVHDRLVRSVQLSSQCENPDSAYLLVDSTFVSQQPHSTLNFIFPSSIEKLRAIPQWFWAEREQQLQGNYTPLVGAVSQACAAWEPLSTENPIDQLIKVASPVHAESRIRILSDLVASNVAHTIEDAYAYTVDADQLAPDIGRVTKPDGTELLAGGYLITDRLAAPPPHALFCDRNIQEYTAGQTFGPEPSTEEQQAAAETIDAPDRDRTAARVAGRSRRSQWSRFSPWRR